MAEHLHTRLKRARKDAGLTMDQVAERLGRSRTWLTQVENGTVRLLPRHLDDLLAVYGKRIDIVNAPAEQEATGEQEQTDPEPERCEIVDLPGIGPTRVHGHLDHQGRVHMAEIVRAAQRRALEELKAEARAELREQLRDVRARWDARRKEREACRETADGQTARLASIEHDIYATVLHELDAALADTTSKETH